MNEYTIEIFRKNDMGVVSLYDTHKLQAANVEVAHMFAVNYIRDFYNEDRYSYKNLKLVKEFYNPDGEI